jgi:glutaredoxin
MTPKLTLYSRKDCCLCDEMKDTIRQVSAKIPLDLEEIDVDGVAELQAEYGAEVPVLFIEGRKAFKYQVTVPELTKKVKQKRRLFFARLFGAIRKETS